MKHADQYAGVFWFLLGGAITASSFSYGLGSVAEPGPGFITFLAGSALTLLSGALFLSAGRRKQGQERLGKLWEGKRTGKAFSIIGLLGIYMFLLLPAGFLITTLVILFFLFQIEGAYSRKTALLASAAVTLVSFIVFDLLLGVQLPRGFMGYTFF